MRPQQAKGAVYLCLLLKMSLHLLVLVTLIRISLQ